MEDSENILIQNYKLPDGWNRPFSDLVLHVPANTYDQLHGIIIPNDLKPINNNSVKAPIHPGNYISNMVHISFRLNSKFDNENYVAAHMKFVKHVLSFKEVVPYNEI